MNMDIDITLNDIEMHYRNCHISKNMLVRDIRIITQLQKSLEANANPKNINLWLKLSTQKLTLLNQFKQQEHTNYTSEPFVFS